MCPSTEVCSSLFGIGWANRSCVPAVFEKQSLPQQAFEMFEQLTCIPKPGVLFSLTLTCLHAAFQNVAKHAEPAADEISQNIESGAHRLGKTAPKATRELTGGAVDAAHELAKSAKPIADQVRVCSRWLCAPYDLSGPIAAGICISVPKSF